MMKMIIFTILLLKIYIHIVHRSLKTDDFVSSLGLSNNIKSKPNQHLPVTDGSGVN